MTEWDAVERALARARDGLSPSDEQVQRMWARLPAVDGAGMAEVFQPALRNGPAAVVQGAVAPWAAMKATGVYGWLVAGVLMGGGFIAGYWAHATVASPAALAATTLEQSELVESAAPPVTSTRAPSVSVNAPTPAHEAPTDEVMAVKPAAPIEPRAKRGTPGRAHGRARLLEPAHDPRLELPLLERIERALRNADAALALALLAELDERYPKTRLVEEREAARLMAHCVAGAPDADRAAERFLQAQPSSVYAARLRALCFIP